MLHTIAAIIHDPKYPSASIITLESTSDDLDIIKAVKDACNEHCRTEGGKRDLEATCGDFNWGDFITYVPNEICERHGFRYVNTVDTITVDHDELLIDALDE